MTGHLPIQNLKMPTISIKGKNTLGIFIITTRMSLVLSEAIQTFNLDIWSRPIKILVEDFPYLITLILLANF